MTTKDTYYGNIVEHTYESNAEGYPIKRTSSDGMLTTYEYECK